MAWTPWKLLAPVVKIPAHSLAETLDEGQAFRWREASKGVWEGQWAKRIARVRAGKKNQLEWSVPVKLKRGAEKAIHGYRKQ